MSDATPARPLPSDEGRGDDATSTIGPPRWVKVMGLIALVVILIFVVIMLLGGGPGGHGPSRHTLPAESSASVFLISATAQHIRIS